MTLKANTTLKTLGHPAWSRMVSRQRVDRRTYRLHYIRRTVREGVNGVFEVRFGDRGRACKHSQQRVEILCRVVLWIVLAQAYHLE